MSAPAPACSESYHTQTGNQVQVANPQQRQQQQTHKHPWAAGCRPPSRGSSSNSSSSNSSSSTAGSSRFNRYHGITQPPPPPPQSSAPPMSADMHGRDCEEASGVTVLVIPWMKAAGSAAAAHITAQQAAAAAAVTAAAAAAHGASAAAKAAAVDAAGGKGPSAPAGAAAAEQQGGDSSSRPLACMPLMHSMPRAAQQPQQQQQWQQQQPFSPQQQGGGAAGTALPGSTANPHSQQLGQVLLLQHPQQQTLQQPQQQTQQQPQQQMLLHQPQQQMLQQLSPFAMQSGTASTTSQVLPVAATAVATAGMLKPTPSLPVALPDMSEVPVSLLTSRMDNSSSCCTSMDLGSLSQQLQLQQQQQQLFQQHCSGDLDSSATSWQSALPGITSVPCSAPVTNGLGSADLSAQQLLLLQPQHMQVQTGSTIAAGSVFAAPGSSSTQYQGVGDQRQELLLQLEQLQQRQLQQQQQSQLQQQQQSQAVVDAEIARLMQLQQRLGGLNQLQAAPAFASTAGEGVYMSNVANQAVVVQHPGLVQYSGTAAVQQYNSTMPQQYSNAPQCNSTAQFSGAAVLAGNPANNASYVPGSSVCVQPYAVGGQPAAAAGQVVLQGSMQRVTEGFSVQQTADGWMQLLPM